MGFNSGICPLLPNRKIGDFRAQSVYYWGAQVGIESPYGLWGALGTKEVIEEQLNQ